MNGNYKLLTYAFVLLFTGLAGCQPTDKSFRNQNKSLTPSVSAPSIISRGGDQNSFSVEINKPAGESHGASHLAQCKRDLESLHRINPTTYDRFRNEYDALMRSSTGFMAVSGDLSDDISALARPRFQFALVDLCYRIKNALAQELLMQAGGEGRH